MQYFSLYLSGKTMVELDLPFLFCKYPNSMVSFSSGMAPRLSIYSLALSQKCLPMPSLAGDTAICCPTVKSLFSSLAVNQQGVETISLNSGVPQVGWEFSSGSIEHAVPQHLEGVWQNFQGREFWFVCCYISWDSRILLTASCPQLLLSALLASTCLKPSCPFSSCMLKSLNAELCGL